MECLENGCPLWESYHELMEVRLVALGKQPWGRPVGVGETWHLLIVKCALCVAVQEANAACGTEHLVGEVEAVIEGGTHAMRLLWDHHFQEEDWGYLIINAQNTCNEEIRMAMLWAVRYKCPSDTQLTFNCYRHWFTLGVHNSEGSVHFFHIKDGVTQREPLAMITYDIGVLPLIRELQDAHTCITQPWYDDDAG